MSHKSFRDYNIGDRIVLTAPGGDASRLQGMNGVPRGETGTLVQSVNTPISKAVPGKPFDSDGDISVQFDGGPYHSVIGLIPKGGTIHVGAEEIELLATEEAQANG